MGFDSTTAVRGSHWLCRNGEVRTFSRHSPIHELPAVFVDDRGSESHRQQDGRMDPVSDSQWDIVNAIGLKPRYQ